jgi:2-keto-3-deoxy-6-phosphogluconate aldolase
MAQFSKLEVLTAMEATGLIPVFYNKDFEVAAQIVNAWFEAGAVCVGMGSKLIVKDLVTAGDWNGIEANVRNALAIIKAFKEKRNRGEK